MAFVQQLPHTGSVPGTTEGDGECLFILSQIYDPEQLPGWSCATLRMPCG